MISRPPLRSVFAITLLAAVACGAEGPTGPQGPAGPEGPVGPIGPGADPSISSLTPLTVYLDRTSPFSIGGSATTWASPTVDFGVGIAASDIVVASPTSIVGMLTVDSTAGLGRRDVSVSDGGQALVLSDGLRVEAPLVIDSIFGSPTQGGRFIVSVRLVDTSRPFDTEDLRLTFPGVSFQTPLFFVSEFSASTTFLLDLDAPVGPASVVARSSIPSRSTPLEVEGRAPVALPMGGTEDGAIEEAYSTDLYSTSAPAGSLVTLTSASSGTAPELAVLHPQGSWSSFRMQPGSVTWFAPDGQAWPVVVLHSDDATGDYSISATAEAASPEGYNAPVGADLSAPDETDVYSFSATAGQTITAVVSAGATNSCSSAGGLDAQLEIVGGGGFAPASTPVYCPSATMEAPVTGTYYVGIRAHWQCPGCTFDYTLTITVE